MRETPHSAPPALECGAPTQLGRDKETCRTLAEKLDTPRRHQSLPHKKKKSGACEDLRPPSFAQHNTPQVIASDHSHLGESRAGRRHCPPHCLVHAPLHPQPQPPHDRSLAPLRSLVHARPASIQRGWLCRRGGGWTSTVSSGSRMMHDNVTHTQSQTRRH